MSTILVVGGGVVGGATGQVLAEVGHDVSFADVSNDARKRWEAAGFTCTPPQHMDLNGVEAVFVAVPTPSRNDIGMDSTFLETAARHIGEALARRTQGPRPVLVWRSTMVPGTTEQLVKIVSKSSQQTAGKDFGVVYMPEYLRAETALNDCRYPRLLLMGVDPDSLWAKLVLRRVWAGVIERRKVPVLYCSVVEAELQKYVHNNFNAVKIAFFNEWRVIVQRMIDMGFQVDPVEMERLFAATANTAEGMWNSDYGIRATRVPTMGSACPRT